MQQNYRRRAGMPPIVVGVDGSPGSKAALRWALRHADRTGADVEALSVWTPQPAVYFGAEWAAAACAGVDLARVTETVLLDTWSWSPAWPPGRPPPPRAWSRAGPPANCSGRPGRHSCSSWAVPPAAGWPGCCWDR
jgi:hypothetical protein